MFIISPCRVGKSEETPQLICEMQDNGIIPNFTNTALQKKVGPCKKKEFLNINYVRT